MRRDDSTPPNEFIRDIIRKTFLAAINALSGSPDKGMPLLAVKEKTDRNEEQKEAATTTPDPSH